jgi:hypothetical protein
MELVPDFIGPHHAPGAKPRHPALDGERVQPATRAPMIPRLAKLAISGRVSGGQVTAYACYRREAVIGGFYAGNFE